MTDLCAAHYAGPTGTVRCTNRARYRRPGGTLVLCGVHRRTSDLPIPATRAVAPSGYRVLSSSAAAHSRPRTVAEAVALARRFAPKGGVVVAADGRVVASVDRDGVRICDEASPAEAKALAA